MTIKYLFEKKYIYKKNTFLKIIQIIFQFQVFAII